MSFVSNGLKGNILTGLAIGIGAILVVPFAARVLFGALKPVAESAVKGGVLLFDSGVQLAAGAWETASRFVAEARSGSGAAEATAAVPKGKPARARARTPRAKAAGTTRKSAPRKKTEKAPEAPES